MDAPFDHHGMLPPEEWIEEPAGSASPWTFRLLSPADCQRMPARPYVIKGLIGKGDHAVMFGQPSAGKSCFAPYLAYAVAQGRSVFGRRVNQGRVLYLAVEDGEGVAARVHALSRRFGDAPDFMLVPDALDLRSEDDSGKRQEIELFIRYWRPTLTVVETLFRAFPGMAENDAADMGRVVQVVRGLSEPSGAAVLAVTHAAKDAGTTPRGHGALNADADLTMHVEGSGNGLRTVKLGKNRNGPSDATLTFVVAVEELGLDQDGDQITAPITVEVEVTEADRLRPKEAKLADKPATMLREVRNALAGGGEPAVPEPGMPTVTAIPRRVLRTELIHRGWFPESVLCSPAATQSKADTADCFATALQSAVLARAGYAIETNALIALKRQGFLAFNRQWVWLPA